MGSTTYSPGMTMHSNWKVPEIEPMGRNFNESNRFYKDPTMPHSRQHGLKYVPPPKAEYLKQLVDE